MASCCSVQGLTALSLFGALSALLVHLFFTNGWMGVQKDATIADHAKVAATVLGCAFLVGALSSTAMKYTQDAARAAQAAVNRGVDGVVGAMGGAEQYEFNDGAHKKYTDTVREFLKAHRRE
jgi:hypothetical protein